MFILSIIINPKFTQMKSSFTLALAAAVAICANAEGRQQAAGTVTIPATNYKAAVKLSKKSPARAKALQKFEGEYEWSRYDLLDYHKTLTSTLEFALTDAATGEFAITGWHSGCTVKAFIDPEAGTMKIQNKQDLGNDMFGDPCSFYLKEVSGSSYTDGATDEEWAVGTIDGKVISFPDDQVWTFGGYPENWIYWTITSENKLTFQGEDEEPGEPIEGVEAIAGEYEYNYNGLLNGSTGPQTGALSITVTNPSTGAVAITGWPQNFVVKGIFDPAAGTLTIANKQSLGKDSYGDSNYFYLKDVTEDGKTVAGANDAAATVGVFADYTITFPSRDIWAIGDYDNETAGYWWMSYNNVLNGVDPNLDPNEGWEDFCTAQFEDGWILTGYTISGAPALPTDIPWTVNVQKSLTEEGTYRLDNPYRADGSPIPAASTKTGGYIVFSLADPDFVIVFPEIFSGALNGTTRLCCVNTEGFYIGLGLTKEEILANVSGTDNYEASTYVEDTHVVSIPKCGFNFAGAFDTYYTWQTQEEESLADNMNTKITLSRGTSAIANVEVDDLNAPVVYYNLQGVRVENPANGVFIRVQGNQATKIVK